ncbi:MAG: PIN domain-containing protein [Bacteroidales bacterium]|nr:PIN domain-containing protein [Bacteroidales bacterium]
MIKVFLDTNIVIDYLAQRTNFYPKASLIISICGDNGFKLLVSSLTFATTSYVLSERNNLSAENIKKLFDNFIAAANVTVVDMLTIRQSISSKFGDFEDAMQYYSAIRENADCIITRNKKDFIESQIPVYEPDEFINKVKEH